MEQSITEILNVIDEALKKFQSAIPSIEQSIFEEIQVIIKDLKIKNGNLLNNVDNLKRILGLATKLEKIIINPEYKEAVENFLGNFLVIADLNLEYFRQFDKKIHPSKSLSLLKQIAVENTINDLLGNGMKASVIETIRKIFFQNITMAGSYAKFEQQLRNEILTNETGDGSLTKYTKSITVDTINQYNRQYHEVIAQDLNFNWGQYVGSNIATTREFCLFLTKKRWVHRSELSKIIHGNIDGHQCKLSKTTGLPLGMYPDTNINNFNILAGGYQCGHSFYWGPDNMVPENIREKFKANNPVP